MKVMLMEYIFGHIQNICPFVILHVHLFKNHVISLLVTHSTKIKILHIVLIRMYVKTITFLCLFLKFCYTVGLTNKRKLFFFHKKSHD